MTPIGLLGVGFLGRTLLHDFTWPNGSWAASRSTDPQSPLPRLAWDWSRLESNHVLPEAPAVLIVTAPPVFRELEPEQNRLHEWGAWMQQHRPQLKRMVYVSTTGVYPRRDGTWSETSSFEPDSLSGRLRLMTEQTLARYFDLQVVRPGGIYGPGRSLVERLKDGRGLPEAQSPTHRIHVYDLAQVVRWLVEHPEGVSPVNAVDEEPCVSWEAGRWLVEHHPELSPDLLPARTVPATEMNAPHRRIDNTRLLQELGLSLRYPTFREGMQ